MDWIQSLGHQEVIIGKYRNYDCTSNVERCSIILLDEATAFSDAENEYKIQQALSSMIKNKKLL